MTPALLLVEVTMQSSWSTFLSMLAQVSVSLLALLFVSFQVTRNRWISDLMRRLIAVQTLLEFLVPSFFSIIALMPISPLALRNIQIAVWQVGGCITSILGIVVAIFVTEYGLKHRSSLDMFGRSQLKLQILVFAEYSILFISSIMGNLELASALIVLLLFSGAWETWQFFAELG